MYFRIITGLLGILYFGWATIVNAQQSRFLYSHLTSEDGLPRGEVMDIAQDQDGIMWIATINGLHRYDGYDFKRYYRDRQDPNSIPVVDIQRLFVDKNNRLWIDAFQQTILFDTGKEEFITFPDLTAENNRILFRSHDGSIFLQQNETVGDTVYFFDVDSLALRAITLKIPNFSDSPIEAGFESQQGELFILHNDWIYQLDKETEETYSTIRLAFIDRKGLDDGRVLSLYQDTEGSWWAGTAQNYVYHQRQRQILSLVTEIPGFPDGTKSFVKSIAIFEDSLGEVWIQGRNSLAIYDLEKRQFSILEPDPCDRQSILSGAIRGYCLDKAGNKWFGNLKGVSILTPAPSSFSHFLIHPISESGGEANTIFSIYQENDGSFWVGGQYHGLLHLGLEKKAIKHYSRLEKNEQQPENTVSALCKDKAGNLWIGTFHHGLYRLDASGELKRIRLFEHKEDERYIREIIEDPSGNIWITSIGHINIYQPTLASFRSIPFKSQVGQVFDIIFDKEGAAWFQGAPGIIQYHLPEDSVWYYEPSSPDTYCLYEDTLRQHIWLGTKADGLVRFNKKTKKIDRYINHNDGLEGNTIYGILSDGRQNLWLSTNKGLASFNMETEQVRNYGLEDGLPFEDFNSGAYFQGKDGQFFFGGEKGIVYFDPEKIFQVENAYQPPVIITSCKVLGKELVLPKPISKTKSIELKSHQNYIEFEFASLDYSYPRNIEYQFTLEDIDDDWSKPDTRRRVYYADLPYGEYRFRVRGTNSHGYWSKNEASLQLKIIPRPWERKSVPYIVGGLFFFLSVAGIYIRQRRKERKLVQEGKQNRMLLLRRQMKKHFVFNILNIVNNYIAKANIEQANDYLTRTAEFLRTELDNSEKQLIPLQTEIDMLELYLGLQSERYKDKFTYKIHSDKELDIKQVYIPSMLIQTFVENAIEHGLVPKKYKGKLEVSFNKKGRYLECIVQDDGIGRTQSKKNTHKDYRKHRPLGIRNVEERIQVINKIYKINASVNIYDLFQSNDPKLTYGTKVIVQFPLKVNI